MTPHTEDPHTEERARHLRTALADALEADGQLRAPRWRKVFEAVPRHRFVPEFWTLADGRRRRVTQSDPRWLDLAYTDDALATQMTGRVATSSSTAPGLMLVMLQALDVAEGHRVLEVATGTGYNAALLAERLGSDAVTTIEVDPELADLAATRLRQCGYTPHVITGDGRTGHPDRAPYDRLIATCGFTTIPPPWLTQVRPGAVIVCPLGSGIARLTAGHDRSAHGRFLPTESYFMTVRAAGTTGTPTHPGRPATATARPTTVDLATPTDDDAFRFILSLAVPDTAYASERDTHGRVTAVELWGADGAWARAEHGTAHQAGPRNLWDAVEAAHDLYLTHNRPGRDRFGITITPDKQLIWLDTPQHPILQTSPA